MLFIAILTHEPADCWTRPENRQKARTWIAGIDDRAAEHGVDVRGAYVTPTEHTFYIVLEADSFEDVTGFLGSPLLEDHDGHVAPVLSLEGASRALFED